MLPGIESFAAKTILAPTLSAATKKGRSKLFGRDDVRAVSKLCHTVLVGVLDKSLEQYEPIDHSDKVHLISLLEEALGTIAEPLGRLNYLHSEEGVADTLDDVYSSDTVDWSTFQIVANGKFVHLDESEIVRAFLRELPAHLSAEASRPDSSLHNLAVQLNARETQQTLSRIAERLGVLIPAGTTSTWASAHTRAVEKQREAIAWQSSVNLARDTYVESKAVAVWRDFDVRTDWYSIVLSRIHEVNAALDGNGLSDRHLRAYASELNAQRASYASVLMGIRQLDLPRLEKLLIAASHQTTANHDANPLVRKAITGIRWLSTQIEHSNHNYALLLVGSFGSGRSRTLAQIAKTVAEREDYVLFISASEHETLRQTLLRQSADLFGRNFRDLSDLAGVIQSEAGPTARVYLLMDDLDRQARHSQQLIKDLRELINESTRWPVLQWILAADSDQFEAVVSSDDPYFWVRYGYIIASKQNSATGWFDVDDSNTEQQLGLRILRDLADEEEHTDINEVISDSATYAYEINHLVSPLAAWMRVESAAAEVAEKPPLTDVNHVAFVRAYWEWIKARLVSSDIEARTLETTITMMARTLNSTNISRLAVEDFLAASTDGGPTGPSRNALLVLSAGGFVSLRWEGDATVERQREYAEPTFPALWGYRIANVVLFDTQYTTGEESAGSIGRTRAAIWPWQKRSKNGEILAEAVCQFVLTQIDDRQPDAANALWTRWARVNTTPRVPLIMAATASQRERQRTVINMISKSGYSAATKRELFVMMRMIGRCRLGTWSADNRVRVLGGHLQSISQHGLDTYLHRVLQVVLKDSVLVTGNNYIETCKSLSGFSQAGAAQLCADLMVEAGKRIYAADTESWIDAVVEVCKRVAPGGRFRDAQRPGRGHGRVGRAVPPRARAEGITSLDRSTFIERFTAAFVAQIISAQGADGCRNLATHGWWTAAEEKNVDVRLADRMRSTLNTTFGAATHHRGGGDQIVLEYQAIVYEIIAGSILRRSDSLVRLEIAFFLIKHSVPTYGRGDVVVDERFWDALKVLSAERALTSKLGSQARELYASNGI